MTDLPPTWTGWHADALRRALRMTNEEFAEHLDVAVRTVVYWRTRPGAPPGLAAATGRRAGAGA